MKLISWNVRGLGDRTKRALVKDLLSRVNLDLVCLQEARLAGFDRRLVKSIWSSHHVGWISLDAFNSANSILLPWKEYCKQVLNPEVGNYSISILCKFRGHPEGWFTGVYGPCFTRSRKLFWRTL